jgi:hypothetical protein
VATASSLGAILLFPVYLTLRAAGSKMFEPERFDYALLAGAVFGIAFGAQLVPWRRGSYVALLAILASGSLLFAFMAIFSIGIAFLPAGIVLTLLLYRALRRWQLGSARPAALGGALVGYGIVLLYIAQAVPATAECFPNGAGSSSGRWRGSGQALTSNGSMSGGPDGVITGRSEYTDSVVTFRCEGARLVEFQRFAR